MVFSEEFRLVDNILSVNKLYIFVKSGGRIVINDVVFRGILLEIRSMFLITKLNLHKLNIVQ